MIYINIIAIIVILAALYTIYDTGKYMKKRRKIAEDDLKVIEKTLLSYRMKNVFYDEDREEHYLLVDLLSAGGEDISTGEEEIKDIMDCIYLDLWEMER